MSRPVTPAAAAQMSTTTPPTAQSLSGSQRPLSPVSVNQAPVISRSNSQRHVSGLQQTNQAPTMSRSNSQRQVSTTASVHGQNQTPTISRSNTQRSAHPTSRPLSYVAGADGVNSEVGNRNSMLHREDTEFSQGGMVNEEDHIPTNEATPGLQRSLSQASQSATTIPSRGGTLKKKASLKKSSSLKRSASKKSSYAGSVRSLQLGEKEKYQVDPEHNSVFYCPVPTSGSPTDLLADRFQAWRRVLKDLINYFRDVQKSYEIRSKTLSSASNTINNTSMPSNFLGTGGINEASKILREFHKVALTEANKSKELENEVILQLTGLRSDLQQKIKEIKSLSGDFKNSVGKEQESTKRVVRALQESLGHVDHDAGSTSGKGDPFLVKMNVDRQIEKQIEEENYLHRAYLNLEASGRELESIVVGEIQKAYNVLANIMKRDADNSYEASEKLKGGPLAMTKDHEWDEFVVHNSQMVDPRVPLRQSQNITYMGKDHPAAIEVKSGMLERKSKYLKNYTPGWYVLSPTHLHEFKSADRIAFQSPVMSLYLPEQKLGTHSEPGSNSHKFMLKGRQTGSMHRGHSWIFRAETHDTMLAWFHDIKELTEKRGEERNEFVRRTHARTLSSGSMKAASINSVESGIEEDEADQVPFSGEQSVRGNSVAEGAAVIGGEAYIMDDNRSDPGWRPPQRPTPGGRFPSDLNVERGLAAPLSPSSGDSYDGTDRDAIAAAGALPGSGLPFAANTSTEPHTELQQGYDQQGTLPSAYGQPNAVQQNYAGQGYANQGNELAGAAGSANNANTAGIQSYTSGGHPAVAPTPAGAVPVENASNYGEWMAPMAATAGVGGAAIGAGATHLYHKAHNQEQQPSNIDDQQSAIPAAGQSSAPIVAATAVPANAPNRPRGMTESTEDTATAISYAPSAHTQTTAHTVSTVPTSTSLIGTEAPAPSQTLAAAGIDPHPVVKPVAAPAVPVGRVSAVTTSSLATPPTGATGVDAAGHLRPEMPRSVASALTITDLHVPGEFPRAV